jgi:hypothetical protein
VGEDNFIFVPLSMMGHIYDCVLPVVGGDDFSFMPLNINMMGHIYDCMFPSEIVFEDLSKEHNGP